MFVVSLLGLITISSALLVPTAAKPVLCGTPTTLLSEGLTSCVDPTSADCRGGMSSAAAYIRRLRSEGNTVTFFPELQRQSSFVQMHPLSWDVNMLAYKRFGVNAFWSTPALTQSQRNFSTLRDASVPLVLSNILVRPSNQWYGFQRREYLDPTSGIGIVVFTDVNQPNSFDWQSTIDQATQTLRRDPRTAVIVMVVDSGVPFADIVSSVRRFKSPPDVIWHPDLNQWERLDDIVGVEADFSSRRLTCISFDFSSGGSLSNASRLSFDLRDLPSELKDAQYYSDITWTQQEANLAAAFDPIVGYTTVMPVTRTGALRLCQAGECPLGNLWTDSLRWKLNADIAFEPSGGIRGPGWPAGPVRMSNLFESLPFANQVCNGTIMGLRLFEIMNYSLALARFQSYGTPTGDRLLQVSGMRVVFNSELEYSRLISMEVYNRQTESYEPVERLKAYKFATNSFVCTAFSPFNDLFSTASYNGERAGEVNDQLVQNVVGEYLTAMSSPSSPLQIGLSDRLVNDTANRNFMSWTQRQENCPVDTFWDPSVASCLDCAEGFEQPSAGATSCVAKSNSTTLIVVIVLALLVVIVVVLAVSLVAWRQTKDVRDVTKAPKEGRISLMFTDIQDSTKLWGTVPMSMSYALDVHHSVIREEIVKNNAYEVKTAGDSFMIACSTETDAVALAMAIQRRLHEEKFPSGITKVYDAPNDEALEEIDDDSSDLVRHTETGFNGLRVRIGIHSGEPNAVFDEVSKGYDYYGPPVNVAARVESVAFGGQVCTTSTVLDHVPDQHGLAIQSIGKHELKGVTDPVEIFEIVPAELKPFRTFVLKKPGKEVEDTNGSDVQSMMSAGELSDVTADHMDFFTALLRTLKPKEKSSVRSLLCNAWRVPDGNDADVALCRRVGKAVKPSVKKAGNRKASYMNSSWLGHSLQSAQMNTSNKERTQTPKNEAKTKNDWSPADVTLEPDGATQMDSLE